VLQRWSNIPVSLQAEVTEERAAAAFAGLKAFAAEHDRDAVLDLFRHVAVEQQGSAPFLDLSPLQVIIIREVHRRVRERWHCPEYGADDRYVAQVHLDFRIVRGQKPVLDGALEDLDSQALLLLDSDNGKYTTFLEISHPTPRQPCD
jgi:hypothetical protein